MRSAGGIAALLVVLIPPAAFAQGSIGFTTNPTTINAGQPFSSMERFKDWVSPHPTMTVGGIEFAQPNTPPRDIAIQSWRVGSTLRLLLTIQDASRRQPQPAPSGQPLAVGDTIIIQIDPNNAKSANLQSDDKRFEIVIKDSAIDTSLTGRRDANGNFWGLNTTAFATVPTLTAASDDAQYVVDVTIATADMGTALGADFGIAIAILNDLGHSHSSANGPVWDMTGVAFPSSVGLAVNSDPLVAQSQEGGGWLEPSRWGTGYWNSTPGTVAFSHMPSYYWSDSIRIGICSSPTFGSVAPSPVWANQKTLTNWYQYYPANPCQMKVWIRIFNSSGQTVAGRFLVVWGRPNIGSTTDWFVAGLSQPVGVTSPSFESYVLWDEPPAVNLTDHPCLKVFFLPATLTAPWDETAIRAIATDQNLQAMLGHYQALGHQVQGQGAQSAQMNFTAWEYPGLGCQTPGCNSVASLLEARPFGHGGPSDAEAVAELQPRRDERPTDFKPVRRTQPYFLVTAVGFGVAPSRVGASKLLHTYLTDVGGVAWSVPVALLASTGKVAFTVDVANPPVLAPAQPKYKLREIRSPVQSIALVAQAVHVGRRSIWDRLLFRKAPPPVIEVEGRPRPLEPGASMPLVITIRGK